MKTASLLLATNAAEPAPCTRAQFKARVASEARAWDEVVSASGLKVD